MALKRETSLRIVTEGIAWLATLCDVRGAIHLFDSHTIAHEFYCRLFNEIYDLKLEVMDRIQSNFPAIDLGDQINKRSFQVTAEKNGEKIQTTLDKYIKHGLSDKYGKLQILVIGEKQSSYKSVKVPTDLTFLPEDDIIDTKGLVKIIETLSTEKLARVAEIIQTEIKIADFPAELLLHVSAYNEPPASWPGSDDVRMTYLTEKTGEEIAIRDFMPYLDTMAAGDPIQPLRYITPTCCPFDWNLPALDFKLLNRTSAPFLMAEANFEVEESRVDPRPVVVVKEDVQQRFAGAFWLVNEGATSLKDVIIRYELLPGNVPLLTNFPKVYPFQVDLGDLDNQAEISVEDSFVECGLDIERLLILMDAIRSDSKSMKVRGEGGIETVMTLDDYQAAIKRCLGPFQDEVGTVIGQINFTESSTMQNYAVRFRALVYIFNKNRLGIFKPPSAVYNVQLEMIGKNYQRQLLDFSHEIKPGESDRFLIKLGINQTSIHRLRVMFRNVDGQAIHSPWISLHCFVPRTRQGRAKHEASETKTVP